MANVGTAAAGKTLIGAGNGASPTYADIGTNSGLTARGVLIAEGNSAFQATAAGSVGQVLQSSGAGANPAYSTSTYPSTTAIGDLVYASSTNTYANLPLGPLNCTLISNGSIPVWLNPRSGFIEHEDWIAATFAGNLNWGRAIVGAGSNAITSDAFLGHPGVLYLSTGTDATGRAMLITLDDCIILGDGEYQIEWLIRIEDLATVAEDYTIRVGFGDTTGSGDWTYGVYFEYTRATSVNWLIKTADNGTRTSTTTSTAVTADAWIRLTININAAATLATYYVNGSSVGTINTNIPDGGTGTDGIGPDIGIIKTAGNTNRNLYVDYCTITCLLTTIR